MSVVRRLTKQRRLLLDELRGSCQHLTAEDLFCRLAEQGCSMSLGTVYRNLNVLCEQGEIQKIEGSFSSDLFDGNTTPHYHFRCQVCGLLEDVDVPILPNVAAFTETKSGHQVLGHHLLFEGICRTCRAQQPTA